jgi:NADPH:quinone reductase
VIVGGTEGADQVRAIVYGSNGGPEVLREIERDVPAPGDNEVLVRVHRSGVNPTDWKSRAGAKAGAPVEPPQVPNQDGSGVVERAGRWVPPDLVGKRVWIQEAAYQRPDGTAQEWTVVPADHVAVLPDSASFDLGASLGVPFVTAHRCLTVHEAGPRSLGPGSMSDRTVLVTGGAGAVGNAAIQLARWSGARVLATVSSDAKAQLATAAGADDVLNYRTQDIATEVRRLCPDGVDILVDVSAAQNAQADVDVLGYNGCVTVYADTAGATVELPTRALMQKNARWQFVLLYTAPPEAKQRAVYDIGLALEAGAIGVGVEHGIELHHFPLAETAAAHAAVEHNTVGKVIIDVIGE